PVDRGLMASIYVTLSYRITTDKVRAIYHDLYDGEQFVDLLPLGEQATLKHVVRRNHCAISLTPVTEQYLHITSVTDNLRKGAASQAVQCFNLMCDFPETTALL
ncbi:MAG: Asd/ArgC dimerization domain-containing protein, partial [Chloroflexota bacterium]